jgi:hypothetical protein
MGPKKYLRAGVQAGQCLGGGGLAAPQRPHMPTSTNHRMITRLISGPHGLPLCRRTCWLPRCSGTSCWLSASCAAPTARPAPTRACRPRTSTPCGRPGTWRQRCACCRCGRGVCVRARARTCMWVCAGVCVAGMGRAGVLLFCVLPCFGDGGRGVPAQGPRFWEWAHPKGCVLAAQPPCPTLGPC